MVDGNWITASDSGLGWCPIRHCLPRSLKPLLQAGIVHVIPVNLRKSGMQRHW